MAHLTSVSRGGDAGKPWRAVCDCGWTEDRRLKLEAIGAAEHHWLSMPLVEG